MQEAAAMERQPHRASPSLQHSPALLRAELTDKVKRKKSKKGKGKQIIPRAQVYVIMSAFHFTKNLADPFNPIHSIFDDLTLSPISYSTSRSVPQITVTEQSHQGRMSQATKPPLPPRFKPFDPLDRH